MLRMQWKTGAEYHNERSIGPVQFLVKTRALCEGSEWESHSDDHFVENPIVTQVADGLYIAVYNSPQADAFGYATSKDGTHWSREVNLSILSTSGPH